MTAVISGIGHTEFSKDSGRSPLQLAAEASRAAIADAGLTPADIDGSVTFVLDRNDELAVMRCLGIPVLRWSARTRGGGGGACATVQLAAGAVLSGQARHVLIWRAFNERSRHRFGQPNPRPPDAAHDWYLPFGLDTPAKVYGLTFQRYMHRYGLTNADFGLYTVVARGYAATNPNAWFYKRPITLADHQASRWIVEPLLRLLDCCQESDGGVALVVSAAEPGSEPGSGPAVRISAAAAAHVLGGDEMYSYYHDDLSVFPEGVALGRSLWASSGLGPSDIDVAMIYENFSPIVFMQLEALGFCGPGEARDFIAYGNIGPGGSLPVNTNGGLLGEGYIHGMNNIIEAVRQLRGTSPNQVAGAEHGGAGERRPQRPHPDDLGDSMDRLISADSHVAISHQQVKANLASRYHDAYDRAQQAFAARMAAAMGAGRANTDSMKRNPHAAFTRPGYADGKARLEDMDTDGVEAEVVYSEVSAFRYIGDMKRRRTGRHPGVQRRADRVRVRRPVPTARVVPDPDRRHPVCAVRGGRAGRRARRQVAPAAGVPDRVRPARLLRRPLLATLVRHRGDGAADLLPHRAQHQPRRPDPARSDPAEGRDGAHGGAVHGRGTGDVDHERGPGAVPIA